MNEGEDSTQFLWCSAPELPQCSEQRIRWNVSKETYNHEVSVRRHCLVFLVFFIKKNVMGSIFSYYGSFGCDFIWVAILRYRRCFCCPEWTIHVLTIIKHQMMMCNAKRVVVVTNLLRVIPRSALPLSSKVLFNVCQLTVVVSQPVSASAHAHHPQQWRFQKAHTGVFIESTVHYLSIIKLQTKLAAS